MKTATWIALMAVAATLLLSICMGARAGEPAVDDYSPLIILGAPHSQIIVQKGRFLCPEDMHRTILMVDDGHAMVGCGLLSNDRASLHVVWENGKEMEIAIHPEKPAPKPEKDEEWSPFNPNPKIWG